MKKFINDFLKRDGLSVFVSTLIIKIIGLLLSIFVVRLLSVEDYGNIAFALSVINILSVFGGLGSNWSLLRYGPIQYSITSKYQIFKYSLFYGTFYTVPLILLIMFGSFFLPANLQDARLYIILLSLSILTNFMYESVKSYLRVIGKNLLYSKSNIIGSVLLLTLAITLSYFFGGYGYAISLVLAPLLAFSLFYKHVLLYSLEKNTPPIEKFFSYGLFVGLGMIANQAIILLGPIIAGLLKASVEEIALFKVATIIPFNLLIIPSLIMTTDFVHFTKNSSNPSLLKNYYFQYFKTVFLLGFIPFGVILYYNKFILMFLFGSNYEAANELSLILIIGVMFSFLFRTPLGNMLAAVGKANWNVYHTLFWVIVFIPMSIYSFWQWGIIGIGISISFIFTCSGFISFVLFLLYIKQIKEVSSE